MNDFRGRPTTGANILRMTGIVKTFGGARALDNAALEVRRGSIHGLVGQNGAGKSTLIKILAGLHQPDEGVIEIDGGQQSRLTPKLAEMLGIHFIHQDRLLPPSFTVGEGLFLGEEPVYAGLRLLNRSGMRREAARLLKSYFDLELPDGALIADLTTAEKQIIQITRALIRKPKILVFDEPTAALVRREADILFGLIRRLAGEGVTILYISHYLREIEEICDAVTVLRNGRDVATLALADTSAAEIGQLMVARETGDLFPSRQAKTGAEHLRVCDLVLEGKFEPLSFTLRRGEILGLTGLLGSGAKDLMRVLFGLETATSGEIVVGERTLRFHTPRQAARARLAAATLRYGALLTFLVILVIFSTAAPFFLSVFNIGNILGQTAITGVLAIGLTVVVIAGGPNVVTGGIDLSLAANMGLSAAVYASLLQAGHGDGVATLAALGTGLGIGAVNAFAVVQVGIVPLLATLAVMNIVTGLELVLTENTVIPASSAVLTGLSSGSLFGIPALGYVLIGISLLIGLIIQNTRFGLRLYAVGEFPEAARAAGIPLKTYVSASFLISGLCGGLAGILNTAYLSGSSTGSGEMLLPVVVTALLGSVFSRRLVPTIGGTLLSALFVGVLLNGFQLLNLSSTLVSGVQGILILLTVSATTLIRREN